MSKAFKKVLNIVKPIAQIAATATGNAWAVPVIEGGSSLAQGKGFGTSLLNAGKAYGLAQLGSSIGKGLGDTALGRGISDLYSGSALESGVNSVSGGINDLYSGSSLQNLVGGASDLLGSSQDAVTMPGIGKVGLDNGTGVRGIGSTLSNSLNGGVSALGSGAPAIEAGGGASSVSPSSESGGMFSDLFKKDNLKYLGMANSLYGNYAAQGALQKATNQANQQLSPYTAIGQKAADTLGGYLGLNGQDASTADILAASPGYKFMLDQGNQQLDRAQAARGGFFSGAALKAAQDYGSGLANQTAQNYYQQLANTMGTGLGAAGQYGANTTAMGTAKAGSQLQTSNMINQLLTGYDPSQRFMGF
jgi:hypothetical protein